MLMRMTGGAALIACALGLAISASAGPYDDVLDNATAAWTLPDGSETDTDSARAQAEYTLGKAYFTLYHEFGHAMITMFKVPIIVQEEAIADSFAGLYAIPTAPDPVRDALVTGAVRAFMDRARVAIDNESVDYADAHLFDAQRAFNAICLFVGGTIDGRFEPLAEEFALPEGRRNYCAAETAEVANGWIAAIPVEKRLDEGQTSTRKIKITYDEPTPELKRVADILKASGLLEAIAADIESSYQLPHDILLTAEVCDEPNEHWYPDEFEIGFCYNYLEYYQTLGINVRFNVREE